MTASASITITPILVTDLLSNNERMPVYIHVIHHAFVAGVTLL